MEKEINDLIEYVNSSEKRKKILLALGNDILTPSEISGMTGITQEEIIQILRELEDKDLIEIVTKKNK